MDGGGDICASICCGACCMFSFSWYYGSGSGTSTSGCCGSCCDKSFNEDSFDEQVRRDMEATRDPNAPRPEQMQPAEKMSITSPKEAANKEDS
ncbi:hypothetical protein ARMGADRAFT_948250 [Armillaria gallica]|uniref:Uncharacterized protein n=1 Tax=Armillaria gallica TaxID=47427 RepID=A0A2H3CQB8_ARMGA|nr:hypothetical protein ARMGADRAFT_948250 [Armillaria gallica]